MKELKRTNYNPRAALLGSRKQMCVHPEVRLMQGNVQNIQCKAYCASRRCGPFGRSAIVIYLLMRKVNSNGKVFHSGNLDSTSCAPSPSYNILFREFFFTIPGVLSLVDDVQMHAPRADGAFLRQEQGIPPLIVAHSRERFRV
eukprot:8012991-Pyramimonas_sp.AAC.2